jgi:4-azaleucine resistance transporter AzlC
MTPPPSSPARPRRDALIVALAVGVFGVAFGVLAVATGLSPAQAQVMSLLVFTGGSQFAAVGVIDAGGTAAAAVGSAALLAARNGLYGLSLNEILRGPRRRKLVAAHLVIDESTAMATAQPDRQSAERLFWFTGLAVLVCWNVGTALGALGGDAIGDPETLGLDAAFPAAFVALMAPHLRRRDGLVAALCGGAIALVTVPLVPAGVPILLAALAVVPAYFVRPEADP